jgi:transposase-like protein
VSRRVSPTERVRAQIDELFASERELGEVLEQVAQLGVCLLMQSALEAEVTEFLGRDRCARGDRARDGYSPVTIKTTASAVTPERPKLRGTDEQFASRLLGAGVCRTNALESLVIAGFVRGLSVRDVELTLADALGVEAALSKSTVSRICEAIKVDLETLGARDLSDLELDYFYLDGSHFLFHQGSAAKPVLVAWGITTDGKPVLVGLTPGASESLDA